MSSGTENYWTQLAKKIGPHAAMERAMGEEEEEDEEVKPPFHDFAEVLHDERRIVLAHHNFVAIKDDDTGNCLLMMPRYDGSILLLLGSSVNRAESLQAQEIAQDFDGIAIGSLLVQAIVSSIDDTVTVQPYLQYPSSRLTDEASTNQENIETFLRPHYGYSMVEGIIATGTILHPRPSELYQ